MTDTLTLGSAPCDEDCAQVGQADYREKALAECNKYRDMLKTKFGNPPTGASLIIHGERHDFGIYYEVAVRYDDNFPEAVDYAFKLESEAPAKWQE